MGEIIQLTAADGHTFDVYKAMPSGTPKGGMLVIQEIFGVNQHMRKVADSYAAEGYAVLAPALFDRAERNFEVGYTPEAVNYLYAEDVLSVIKDYSQFYFPTLFDEP